TVAQVEGFLEGQAQGLGESFVCRRNVKVRGNSFEAGRDRGVIGGGCCEGFLRQPPLGGERECAAGAGEFFGNRLVVSRRSDDGDVVKILGGGADHGGSADVDVLNQLLESHAGLGGSFFEGVEIHDDHVDWRDAV